MLIRFLLYRSTATRSSYILYTIFNFPAIFIEFWLESIGRPTTTNGEIKRSGEDLEAKGLTEYLWDVLYWTWACLVGAAVFGDRAWWLWGVVPLYSAWAAWTTYGGMRESMGGMMGGASAGEGGGESKRQKKMDKRGEKVRYR